MSINNVTCTEHNTAYTILPHMDGIHIHVRKTHTDAGTHTHTHTHTHTSGYLADPLQLGIAVEGRGIEGPGVNVVEQGLKQQPQAGLHCLGGGGGRQNTHAITSPPQAARR